MGVTVRRPPADASMEDRKQFWRDVVDGLNALGVGHGQDVELTVPAVRDDANRPKFGRNAESRKAALQGLPRRGTQRAEVLRALTLQPATCDELEGFLGRAHQTVSARVNELRDGGFIEQLHEAGDPVVGLTRRGSEAAVWTLTPKGRDAVSALGAAAESS